METPDITSNVEVPDEVISPVTLPVTLPVKGPKKEVAEDTPTMSKASVGVDEPIPTRPEPS